MRQHTVAVMAIAMALGTVVAPAVWAQSDATLSGLALSAGELSPAFASNTFSYTAGVRGATATVTVTPTAADPSATITVNGNPVTSGSPSGAISLNPGNNAMAAVVVSADTTATNTYTLVVTRNASVIYEPFDYPVGGLNGRGGTTEVGLTGTWAAHAESLVVGSSLSYGALPVSGGSIGKLSYYVNRFGGARAVSASALAGNGLLADGATLWFSLVLGYGRDANGTAANLTNARLGFALANSSFNTGNYKYWINDEGAQLGSGLGVTLGRINAVNGRTVATQFRDLASGDNIAGNVLGTFTGAAYGTDQYRLIVGKITWGAVSDTIELYQPGTDLCLPAAPISTLTVSVDQSTYDTITWTRSDPMVMDEIRFGATYEALIGASPVCWDLNGDTAGAGGAAPSGAWDATSPNWNPASAGTSPTAAWSSGNAAVFAAGTNATGAYTVTVDGTPDIGGVSFEEGTVTLTNGTALRLVGDSVVAVATSGTATVATPLADDGAARQLTKAGAGALVLSGANSYSGATSVAQGTLVLAGDNSAAAGGMAINGGVAQFEAPAAINGTARNVTINAGGAVAFGASFGEGNIPAALTDRIVTTSAGAVAADNYAGTAFDFNTPGLDAAHLGAVGNVTYTGALTPNGTAYRLGGGGGMLTMNNANAVTGSGATLTIGGNVTLPAANDHTGGTTLNAGTLILGDAGALGTGAFTIAGVGTVQAAGTIVTVNPVAANSDFAGAGAGALTLGDMTLSASRVITLNTTAGVTTFGAISGANTALTFAGNGNAAVTGVIGTGTGALTKNGAGMLALTGTNTYSGVTTINAGTLSAGKLADGDLASSVGASGNADTSLVLGNGATLRYTGAGDSTDRRFRLNGNVVGLSITLDASGAGPVNFTNPTGPTHGTANQTRTLNLTGANTGANTLAAGIADNGTGVLRLVKDGAGTWVLAGANTYSGATTVKGGALWGATGGSCALSAITVTNTPGNTAALGVRVTDSAMQWTCASLAFTTNGAGAQLQFTFDVAPGPLAPLGITGNLVFNGVPEVVVDAAGLAGGTYPLLAVGGVAPSAVPKVSVTGYAEGQAYLFWGGTDNKTLFFALPGGGAMIIVR